MSYEASSITPANHWRKLYAAALSAAPHIFIFTDLMAAVAFVVLAVLR